MQFTSTSSSSNVSNWQAIKNFQSNHPQFSLDQLRWLIRTNPNGFEKVHTKVGKRIYLNEQRFATWLEQKANGGAA